MKTAMLPIILWIILNCLWPRMSGQSPLDLKAEVILKVAAMEKNISVGDRKVSIYVMGASKLAESLQQFIGHPIGESRLADSFIRR